MQNLIAAHFARFSPIVERIIKANPAPATLWHCSRGKAARDLVQDAADDLRFGDDPQEVADRTAAKLAAMEAAPAREDGSWS